MAVGTLLSRLTGFGRIIALAFVLGRHGLADAYNLANTTPNIIYDLVLGGVLAATLVPVFVQRTADRSEDEAWDAISAVASLAAVLLVGLTVVFEIVAPLLIRVYSVGAAHGSAAQQSAATSLLRLFAPQLLFYGLISLTTALLNTRRSFVAPMFSPIANNLLVTGALLAVPHVAHGLTVQSIQHHAGALYLLGLGTTAGVVIQLLGQLPALRSAGVRLRWLWAPHHEAVRAVLRLSGWTFGFVAANQVALWVMLVLANHHPGSGDVSAYTYAWAFFQLPYGIVAVSIMSAIQPELAEMWTLGRLGDFRRTLARGLRSTTAIIVPAAIGYVLLARAIIELLLRHGRFTTADSHSTGAVLALFALGLPGFCAFLLLTRAYQAMQDTRTVFYLYLIENAINVAAGVALYSVMGVRGLALSVSIAYTVAAGVALVDIRRRLGGVSGPMLARSAGRIGAAGALMGVAVALVEAAMPANQLGLVLAGEVVVSVVVGVVVYFGAAGVLASMSGRKPPHQGRPAPKRGANHDGLVALGRQMRR